MRPIPIILLLAASIAAWAAAPLRVAVESATILSGPGKEPPPGSAPFEPRIQAQVTVTGLKPGAVPEFRLWRAPETAVKALRRGRLIHLGAAGFTRVEGPVRPLGTKNSYQVLAPVGTVWNPRECLIVEVLLRGRWAGRGAAPLLEMNLPRAPRPGEAEVQR
ncbi:MAG: hypothetical protein Q8K67_04065 [Geothrix sp.]|nr:hypothetical protein [Geothrix sp.]